MQTALKEMAGRPRKYGSEETDSLSLRLPKSVLQYLGPNSTAQREMAIEAIFFEKALTEALKEMRQELLMSATLRGQEYSLDRPDTIARLVKLGLSAEKKNRK